MACCDNRNNPTRKERAIPDGFEPCCSIPGQRCLCLPYHDPWLITGQILTIVSVGFAWVHFVTFLIGFIGLTLFQLLWCVRMRGASLVGHMVIAGLTSIANLIIAIYALVAWRKKRWCDTFVFYSNDYYYDDDTRNWPNNDYCHEKTWFAIALVCALLWAGATFCIAWFVKSGRHGKCEEKITMPTTASTEVEITATASNKKTQRGSAITEASVLERETKDGQGCFVCLPYDDPWLITAQILTIASVGFAWISRPALVVNLIGIALYQFLWCVRMKTVPLICLMVVAGVTSVTNLGISMYVLIAWRNTRYCEAFTWYTDGWLNWRTTDYCPEKTYFAIALVCALLWAAVTFCTVWFVTSGRHAKWQELHATEVELGAGEDVVDASVSEVRSSLAEFEIFASQWNANHGRDEEDVVATIEKEVPVVVTAVAVPDVEVDAVVLDEDR